MIQYMKYREYMGSVERSAEDNMLHGSLAGIKDSVSYHGCNLDELQAAFIEAVDDYLIMCEAEGLQPESPFNGTVEQAMAQYASA
ncbi:MAG: hypothetical protein FWB88_08740 [Defluviitaleaceae bacterium]|nr:hypothetical protein [Defluviitaleaceae bacterium]MCL2240031.1 hypothetical protein [Defluviitaleaceae bacterium]